MPRAPRNMIDDAYQRLMLADFGGGLNTGGLRLGTPRTASEPWQWQVDSPSWERARRLHP